jgi:hypothetical protein
VNVTWHSFDLRSGRRGQQLHMQARGNPSRILCQPTELSISTRIWDQGRPVPGWDQATLPGRTMLVALDADTEEPLWGGMVYRRRSMSGDWVNLDTVTLEGYFDRRYVSDHTYTFVDQSLIAEGLIADATTDGVEMVVDAIASHRFRERQYFQDEDKTVLSVLTELAGIASGIEFTIDLEWADDTHTVLQRVVRVAERIGSGSAHPTAVFTMPGCVVDFSYIEDFSTEHGANAVQAVSSGEGDTRPESRWMTVLQAGWARFEKKFTPSTSITHRPTLDLHARGEVLQTWDGMKELTLEAELTTAPRLGLVWRLGDDVGVSLTCPRFPARLNADGAMVPGYQANVRAIGWELDLDAHRVRPRLLEADEVEVESL